MKRLLQDGFRRQATAQPGALALVGTAESLTYSQLDQASNRLANRLRREGCRRGDRVALLLPKSPAAIVAIMAVLKADAAYVPVDTSAPPARAARILGKADPSWALVTPPTAGLLARALDGRPPHSIRVGWLGPGSPPADLPMALRLDELTAESKDPPVAENSPDDPAHILFTSGSTGEPKGVVITHANVIAFLDWALDHFETVPADRVSCHPPLHFDLSTFDVHGTLAAGASLHLVAPDLSLVPHRLAAFIRERELTQWFSVPSILTYLAKFDAVRPHDFPSLKRLLWCGEVLPTPVLAYWMKRLPHVRFTNLYGPTEATIASSFYDVPHCPTSDNDPVPIGSACRGEELRILGEDRREVPLGQIGELFIKGVGLSPGYWRDPEITASVFVTDPADGARIYRTGDLARVGPDGLVYYLGRADSQIKSRGYRIELGEIETALAAIPGLVEAAAVAISTDGFEGTAICCAYVATQESGLEPAGLRRRLARDLPSYMLPLRWLPLEALPKNQNGKIDRRRLREIFTEQERSRDGESISPA